MRYFIELAYNGTRLNGWQRQPNAPSVQATIEDAFRLILRQTDLEIVGCGRTDAGVHASKYFAHFDFESGFPKGFLKRANQMVGQDIFLKKIYPVAPEAHARFDAFERGYQYAITFQKSVFLRETEWHFPFGDRLDVEKMEKAAELLRGYSDFAPFCKTNSDAQTMRCENLKMDWYFTYDGILLHIYASRFLRGMVRLIVGACINVGLGQISLEELKAAMDNQTPLKKSYSVPPTGLMLSEVKYPFEMTPQ